VGDLVSHSKIGTPGIILEIFTVRDSICAVVNYGVDTRTEKIKDLLPTVDKVKEIFHENG
tara:strand:+ start:4104 stop:4283 length:180 start_codon:yes stop_codon:yes gene_type:complete